MKTAIIIVTYNRLELLKECIGHAINQNGHEVELFIINNASNDGTKFFLIHECEKHPNIHVVNMPENLGGAGGFSCGLRTAFIESECEMFLLIDDDAMLESDYLKNIYQYYSREYEAYSGSVYVKEQIDISHRLTKKYGQIPIAQYKEEIFECDIATFCGLLVSRSLVEKIGFPREDFFIWNDDTEYSYRIGKYSKILNISNAILKHKTTFNINKNVNLKDSWKEYYGLRNSFVIYLENNMHIKFINKLVRTVLKAIYFIIIALMDKTNRTTYIYNAVLRRDAIIDAMAGNMGKNIKYLS